MQVEVHACFVVFEHGATVKDAANGDLRVDFEEKCDVRLRGKSIVVMHPIRIASANDVAGKSGEKISVGENDIAGAEQRPNLSFIAVGKIGAMDERKCSRRQQFGFGKPEFGIRKRG